MKLSRFISKLDVPLLVTTIILFIFGLLNIVNASSQAVVLRYGTNIYYYFYRQLAVLIIGFVLALILFFIPTKKYYRWILLLYLGEIGLLTYLYLFGESYLGSVNWIDFHGIRFQPSELAKPIMIIAVALLFERFCSKLRNNRRYTRYDHYKLIGIIILIGSIFPAFVFLEKDLGTTLILVSIFGIMFLASPIQRVEKFQSIILIIIALIIGGFIYSLKSGGNLFTDEQKSRLDFYNPCANYEEGGYQTCNGFIAINSGGLLGVGIGNSKQVSYLPESHTDSVFAIIAEEYGLLFCTAIFIFYLIILYRIFNLASQVSDIRNKYICLGVGIYIVMHIIINLGGLFGSMPLTGVPLPFFSYGGSYTISLICSLAIVQRICYENKTKKIKIR